VEIHVSEQLVTIHINPYFLRLSFPGNLLEDDDSNASYDPTSGYFTVILTKQTACQTFEDLDLLSKLLAPLPPKPKPSIEVLESSTASGSQSEDEPDCDDGLTNRTAQLSLTEEREEILKGALDHYPLAPILTHLKSCRK
jgi:protein SHQ1